MLCLTAHLSPQYLEHGSRKETKLIRNDNDDDSSLLIVQNFM